MLDADTARKVLVAPGAGADISATRHAGLARLEPLTARAAQWMRTTVAEDSAWDGDALVLEMRCFPDIADAAIAQGLTFERDALPN